MLVTRYRFRFTITHTIKIQCYSISSLNETSKIRRSNISPFIIESWTIHITKFLSLQKKTLSNLWRSIIINTLTLQIRRKKKQLLLTPGANHMHYPWRLHPFGHIPIHCSLIFHLHCIPFILFYFFSFYFPSSINRTKKKNKVATMLFRFIFSNIYKWILFFLRIKFNLRN